MGSPNKRTRVERAELLFTTIEEMIEAKKKNKADIIFDKLPEEKKERFRTAIKKEIDNIETGAYRPLSLDESEKVREQHADKILQSRYVLVEKGIEADDIEKAKKDAIVPR